MSNKVCFIIAHKYFRGYESYLKYYIDNIQTFYPEALTIVVDNNSVHAEQDIFTKLRTLPNTIFLTNNIECKFELGAYQVGLKYILDNDLADQYSHFVFSQENFVLRNYYDFNTLVERNIFACPINSMRPGGDGYLRDYCNQILQSIGLPIDIWGQSDFCWCHSFIVANNKIKQLYNYLKKIVITTRHESEASERYLGVILFDLNEWRPCGDVDGSCLNLHERHYDCWNPDFYASVTSYFRKRVMQRNESTKDKE